jgi:hypothetical protein
MPRKIVYLYLHVFNDRRCSHLEVLAVCLLRYLPYVGRQATVLLLFASITPGYTNRFANSLFNHGPWDLHFIFPAYS